jgi:hypothetical protein
VVVRKMLRVLISFRLPRMQEASSGRCKDGARAICGRLTIRFLPLRRSCSVVKMLQPIGLTAPWLTTVEAHNLFTPQDRLQLGTGPIRL